MQMQTMKPENREDVDSGTKMLPLFKLGNEFSSSWDLGEIVDFPVQIEVFLAAILPH